MFKGKRKGIWGPSPSSQERHVAEILRAILHFIHTEVGVWPAESSKIHINGEMAFRLEQGKKRG